MLAPRVAVTHPRFVVLFLCLVSFLPWGPPPHKAELVLSAEGAPRGPPVGRGVGPRSRAHTSPPPREPPQSPAQLVPRHFQNPGIRTSCPFPPPPPDPSTGTVEGLKAWQCQGSRPEGTSLAAGSLGWLRGPWLILPSFANQWKSSLQGTAFPACPALGAGAGHAGNRSPYNSGAEKIGKR